MGTKVEVAKHRIFDDAMLAASDIKLFPGTSRDATPDQMAEQVTKALAQIETGDYDLIDKFED